MRVLTNQEEIDAYYLSDPVHPRAAGVMWVALIERRIDKLFETALRPDKKVYDELLQPTGALGNYAVKARLSYMLGWIHKDVYDDLVLMAKIRNRFAHVIEAKDFSDQKISPWLKSMHVYKIIEPMLKEAKEFANTDPTSLNLALVRQLEFCRTDDQAAFRLCVDFIMKHLEKCRSNMASNLSKLPGHWMVADSPDEQK